jgi:hypothetical protein
VSERHVCNARGANLMPSRAIFVALTELREAEAVKFIGTWIYLSIRMYSTEWSCHNCTRRDGYAVRKCKWTQCEPNEHNWQICVSN